MDRVFFLVYAMADTRPRKQIDWEKIEAEYRAGVLTLREIAAASGITHGAVNKRAKRDGWDRDLSAKINAKVDALVSRAEVSSQVSKTTEKEVVEANARALLAVRLEQRADVRRTKARVADLFARLERRDGGAEELSFKEESACVKQLADAMKTAIGLECEVWGIANAPEKIEVAVSGAVDVPMYLQEMIHGAVPR